MSKSEQDIRRDERARIARRLRAMAGAKRRAARRLRSLYYLSFADALLNVARRITEEDHD